MNTRRGFLSLLPGLAAGAFGLRKARAAMSAGKHIPGQGIVTQRPDGTRVCRQGIWKVPLGMWRDDLPMPEGTEVLAVSPHVYFAENAMAVKVYHPSLPETEEAHVVPQVAPRSFDGGPLVWGIIATWTAEAEIDPSAGVLARNEARKIRQPAS